MSVYARKEKDVEEGVESTEHDGSVTVTNNWGVDLSQVTIRHRIDNNSGKESQETYNSLPQGDTTKAMDFKYETGFGSDYDYWWIKFVTIGGETWSCKDNFYCSISSSDDGKVSIKLNGDINEMAVDFSSSSGCVVSLDQD